MAEQGSAHSLDAEHLGTNTHGHVAGKVSLGVPGQGRMQEPRRGRKGTTTLLLAFLLMGLSIVFEVLGYFLGSAFGIGEDLGVTFGMAVASVVGIAVMGISLLKPTREGLVTAFKQGWWVLFVALGLFVVDVSAEIADGNFVLAEGWAGRVVWVLAYCLLIGLAEEGLFRGLLFCGLLDALGSNKRGIVVAATISAVAFGSAHVDWAGLDYTAPLQVIQALLKTAQTGVYGFFLACLVLKTKDVVGAALLHGLDDFILMVPSVALFGESIDIEYVSTGEDAMATVILYIIIIALYLPLLMRGIRMLREAPVPDHGPFHKGA